MKPQERGARVHMYEIRRCASSKSMIPDTYSLQSTDSSQSCTCRTTVVSRIEICSFITLYECHKVPHRKPTDRALHKTAVAGVELNLNLNQLITCGCA